MTPTPFVDPDAFRAFEHAGWERASRIYADNWGELTCQTIEPIIDAVALAPGKRLIDVACGPGWLAAAAARRGAVVTGVDFSQAMVAEAQHRYPGIEFREGDAEGLPFAGGAFDALVMNFGLLHLARPEQALAEAHRVLRPGGRIAFTAWAPSEEAVGFDIVLRAIRAHGNLEVPLPPGPPFFRFSDAEECKRGLASAGFAGPIVTRVPQVWRLPSAKAFFETMLNGTVRTAGLLRAQTAEALAAICEAVIEGARAYETPTGIELPMPAVLASGTKPLQ